ncbi:MAG: hypothetical protein WBA74_09790, partial [Cyclobacteriaceae bacterium]
HRRVVEDDSHGNRKLKVSLAVRDYFLYHYVSAKVTGYARRRGSWKKRRFHKNLTIAGNMWNNYDNQNTRCNPDNMIYHTESTSGSRKKIKIKITKWNYGELSLEENGFNATGSVGSLTVIAPM